MARTCTICEHKKRTAIDRTLLADGASVRRIAARFGLAETTLRRHRKQHLASRMAAASDQHLEADLITSIGVRQQLQTINREALRLLEDAKQDGDRRGQLQALDRLHRQIELAAKLASLIQDGTTVSVNVEVDSGWPALRSVILETLQEHPAALQAVADRLAQMEARQ